MDVSALADTLNSYADVIKAVQVVFLALTGLVCGYKWVKGSMFL